MSRASTHGAQYLLHGLMLPSLIPWSLDPLIPDCSCSKPCISASAGCFPICWSEVEALELQPPGSALRSFEMEGIWSSDKFTRKPGIDYINLYNTITMDLRVSPNITEWDNPKQDLVFPSFVALLDTFQVGRACSLPTAVVNSSAVLHDTWPGELHCRGTQPPKESGFKMMWFMMMLQKYDGYWWLRFSKNSRYVI